MLFLRDSQWRGDVVEKRHGRVIDELLVDEGDFSFLYGKVGDIYTVVEDPACCWFLDACQDFDVIAVRFSKSMASRNPEMT